MTNVMLSLPDIYSTPVEIRINDKAFNGITCNTDVNANTRISQNIPKQDSVQTSYRVESNIPESPGILITPASNTEHVKQDTANEEISTSTSASLKTFLPQDDILVSPRLSGKSPESPRFLVRPPLKNRLSAPKILESVYERLVPPDSPNLKHQTLYTPRTFRENLSLTPPSSRNSQNSSGCVSREPSVENMLDLQELEKSLRNIPSVGHMRHNYVNLPERYKTTTTSRKKESVPADKSVTTAIDKEDQEERKQDINTALEWLKQEIMLMKKQDHVLMKQLLDLRSSISSIRADRIQQHFHGSINLCFSSSSDITSLDGSYQSLDDVRHNGDHLSPRYGLRDVEMFEFRARTMSMLTPKNSGMLYLKPKSKETWI